jgi:endoglucanase
LARVLSGAAAVTVGVVAGVAIFAGGGATPSQAQRDARAFLRAYVAPSGRVIRLDQGGDTVSEGQAYALLLAEFTGQTGMFDRVWSWTRAHLQLPDGQLAYATNATGSVRDAQPASDADVLVAWALSRATGPAAAADHREARRIAGALLAHDTIVRDGRTLLAAGPWATGSPGSLNPSYWAPSAFAALAGFTGDARWRALATGAQAAEATLTRSGALLPPDWARLDGGALSATPAPGGGAPQTQYGLDAQRLVVWLASSCRPADRRLASHWWTVLSRGRLAAALALTPSGQVVSANSNALPLVAAAAAGSAAGDTGGRDRYLAAARAEQAAHPTYYGGAWLALGEGLLGGALDGCANGGGGA